MTDTKSDSTAMDSDNQTEVKTEIKQEERSKGSEKVDGEVKVTEESTNGSEKVDGEAKVKEESTNDTEKVDGKAEVKKEEITNGSVKVDPEREEEIARQISYYFGDMNLPRDKFLQEQIKLDDGWVPLKTLMTFNRLKQLTTNPEAVVESLRKASKQFIEVSEDGIKIRRSPAFPLPEMTEEYRESVTKRTVYSKGFPTTGVTIDDLMDFYKQFGTVDTIQKRTLVEKKTKEVKFKGSVFVTFDTEETASKYLALESVKFGDVELIRKLQSVYFEDKKKERDERWGRKSKGKSEKSDKPEEEEKAKDMLSEVPRGCILHLAGFPESPVIDRDSIREKVTEAGGDVAFITYNRGDKEAYVRLEGSEEKPAAKVLEKLADQKLRVDETDLPARVLEGEEETEFLRRSLEDRDKRRQNNQHGKRRNAQHNQHGKRRNFKNSYRGKRHSGDDGGPPAKRERN